MSVGRRDTTTVKRKTRGEDVFADCPVLCTSLAVYFGSRKRRKLTAKQIVCIPKPTLRVGPCHDKT